MRKENILKAIAEAKELIHRANICLDELKIMNGSNKGWQFYICGTKNSGALRRQSMELTRALVRLRKF